MDIASVIAARRSCRAYRDEPVPRAHIEKLIAAARLAPSACNRQPWRFAVLQNAEQRHRLTTRGFLPGIPMKWARDAPVLIVVGMVKSAVTHRLGRWLSGIDYPWIDIGIAGEHLVLQATELGLGTCWIGWIKPGTIRRLAGWPRSVRVAAVITVGWPADPPPGTPSPRKDATEIAKWL